jgi:hypothetical protein
MSERGDVLVGEVVSRDIKNIDRMATVADAILAMTASKVTVIAIYLGNPGLVLERRSSLAAAPSALGDLKHGLGILWGPLLEQ